MTNKSAADLVRIITEHQLRVFSTADFVTLTGMSPEAATQALRRLQLKDVLLRVKRGVWINRLRQLNPFEIVSSLAKPWPAYISLYSALSLHGITEEIPHAVYAVSPGRSKQFKNSLAAFHFYQIPKDLMWGYEIKQMGKAIFPIAEPEKAFLDLLYFSLKPRTRLNFPYKRDGQWQFDMNKLKAYAIRFNSLEMLDSLSQHKLL